MGFTNKYSAVAVACSIALVGCGGGSATEVFEGSSNELADDGTDVEASEGSFFSADDGIGFASNIGENLSAVVTRAVSASATELGTSGGSGTDNDTDTANAECDSGSVSASVGTDENDELQNASLVFNNCVIDGQTTTGSMAFSVSSTGASDVVDIEFADFGSTGPEGDSFIDGGVNFSIDDNLSASVSGTQIALTADGETVVFSNFALNVSTDNITETTSIDGQASIATSSDGSIEFSISPAFSIAAEDDNPAIGTLNLTHSDGSFLIIDANTGNPDTYAFTVSGDGAVTTGVGRWDDEDFAAPAIAYSSFNNSNF